MGGAGWKMWKGVKKEGRTHGGVQPRDDIEKNLDFNIFTSRRSGINSV